MYGECVLLELDCSMFAHLCKTYQFVLIMLMIITHILTYLFYIIFILLTFEFADTIFVHSDVCVLATWQRLLARGCRRSSDVSGWC